MSAEHMRKRIERLQEAPLSEFVGLVSPAGGTMAMSVKGFPLFAYVPLCAWRRDGGPLIVEDLIVLEHPFERISQTVAGDSLVAFTAHFVKVDGRAEALLAGKTFRASSDPELETLRSQRLLVRSFHHPVFGEFVEQRPEGSFQSSEFDWDGTNIKIDIDARDPETAYAIADSMRAMYENRAELTPVLLKSIFHELRRGTLLLSIHVDDRRRPTFWYRTFDITGYEEIEFEVRYFPDLGTAEAYGH